MEMLLHYLLLLFNRLNEMRHYVVSEVFDVWEFEAKHARRLLDELELHKFNDTDGGVRINNCFTSKLPLDFSARTALSIIDVSRSRYRLAL